MDLVNLESPPPDDSEEESNDAQKEDISDANECVNEEAKSETTLDATPDQTPDATPDPTPDATKEEIVSDEWLFYLFLFSYIERDDNCGLIFISDRNNHSSMRKI